MRSFKAVGLSFVAGSAMTMLGGVGTAGAQDVVAGAQQDVATVAVAASQARAEQAAADDARNRADDLAKMGGPAYKSGAFDSANRDATRHQDAADAARGVITGANWAPYAQSPAMADAEERLADLKASGGWAYKSGAVDRQEAEIRALKAGGGPAATVSPAEPTQPESARKPIESVQPQYPVDQTNE